MRRQNNYRLVPRYLRGGLPVLMRRFGVPVVKFIKKTIGKGKGKKFNYGNAKGHLLHAKRMQNVEDEYAEIYRNASPREQDFMRRTGQTPDHMPVKFDPKNKGELTTTKKPTKKPTGETGTKKPGTGKPGSGTGASVGASTGKRSTGVPKNRALVPRKNTLPANTPPTTPPVNPTSKLSLSDKLKWGAGAALLLGTAALLSGDNNNSEEVSTEGTNDLGEDTPQLVNNFDHVDDTDLAPTPNPAQQQQDPTLQTNPRDVSTSTPVGNTNANPSTQQNTAGTQGAAQNTVVQTTVPVASPFPEGYVIDRRGVRHQLDRIADGAYGSNTYELVIGLENTPDSNPFKRALMNRLGMSVWNSNEAYNRLAQMGIRGYIGGRDRKRLRNLINSGTNINGEINGFKTGGKLKLVKRYV